MDTQGTFDSESSMEDSSVVFSLSLLVSSTLVYNLSHNIQEDDLMNLQTFTPVGLQARSDTEDSTAFQKLVFLVRDWNYPAQLRYGTEGGEKLLEERLEIKSCQHPSHQDLRRDLRKCFTDISCYLMPHPGVKVLESVEFDGRLSEIDRKFVKHLRVLVPLLLAPENLVGKKFGGQTIRAKDLFDSFKMFMERFKAPGLVKPTTVTECMARAASQAALGAAKEDYVRNMEAIVRQNQAIAMDKLKSDHENFKRRAVDLYKENNEIGARIKKSIFEQCKKQLVNGINQLYTTMYAPRVGSQAMLTACKSQYERAMDSLVKNEASTLTLEELADFHERQGQRAIKKYQDENEFGQNDPDMASKCETLLQKELVELHEVEYAPLVSSRAALASCLEQYKEALSDCHGDRTKLSLEYLMAKHYEWRGNSIVNYEARNILSRKNPTIRQEYEERLLKEIDDVCGKEVELRTNSIAALDAGLKLYVDAMEAYLDMNQKLSLASLVDQHEDVMAKAIATYQNRNEIAKKNPSVFEGYQELMEEDIYKYCEKDARIAGLMIELQAAQRRKKCWIM